MHLPDTAQEGGGVKQPSVGKKYCLHLPATAQEGRGQIGSAPPPHERWSLLHGGRDVVQGCFLVGNNQLTSPTPYTLYYYLPELVMVDTSVPRKFIHCSPCLPCPCFRGALLHTEVSLCESHRPAPCYPSTDLHCSTNCVGPGYCEASTIHSFPHSLLVAFHQGPRPVTTCGPILPFKSPSSSSCDQQ